MTTRSRVAVLAALVPLIAVVTAVVTLAVTDAPGSGTASAAKPNGTSIVISNFAFSPPTLHVAPGTTIAVTNNDGVAHTVTADDKSFDTGDLAGGAKGTITVKSPGKYAYHCDIHNYMTGVIEVK
jgi:plastocyanin